MFCLKLSVVCWVFFDVCLLSCNVRSACCPLCVVRCVSSLLCMFVVWYWSLACSMFVVRSLLFVVWCLLLFNAFEGLIGVRCLLFVVVC